MTDVYTEFVNRFVQQNKSDQSNSLYVYGNGNNGKSTRKKHIEETFPEVTYSLPAQIIDRKSSHRIFEYLCRQIPTNARLCFIDESTHMEPIRMEQLAHRFPNVGFIINSNLSPPADLNAILLQLA